MADQTTRPTLVIGAAGMLGRAVCAELRSRGDAFEAVDYVPDPSAGIGPFDMSSPDDLLRIAGGQWGVVINCAAWTDVDGAEEHEDAATKLNGDAVGMLGAACRDGNAVCVHYSTDYVFDGNGAEPYPVDHPVDPLNAYGRSKAVGEKLLAEAGAEHIIIRTSWLYGPWGKNFVLTMMALTRSKDALKVVDDQRGRPTSVLTLANTTMVLLDAGARGVFHGTDGGECTWHGLACAVRDAIGAPCEIEPCTTGEFPRPAKRPAYSVLDLSKTAAVVGEPEHWETELRRVIAIAEKTEKTESGSKA